MNSPNNPYWIYEPEEVSDEPISECCLEELETARRKENGFWVLIHYCPKCQSDLTEDGSLIEMEV